MPSSTIITNLTLCCFLHHPSAVSLALLFHSFQVALDHACHHCASDDLGVALIVVYW